MIQIDPNNLDQDVVTLGKAVSGRESNYGKNKVSKLSLQENSHGSLQYTPDRFNKDGIKYLGGKDLAGNRLNINDDSHQKLVFYARTKTLKDQGYGVDQLAYGHNAGDGNIDKDYTKIDPFINRFGNKADPRGYVNDVVGRYRKMKGEEVSSPNQTEEPEGDGFIKSAIKGITQPFEQLSRAGGDILTSLTGGDVEKNSTFKSMIFNEDIQRLGYDDQGNELSGGDTALQTGGAVLSAGSNFIPVAKAGRILNGVKSGIIKGAGVAGKTGLQAGVAYGAGESLVRNPNQEIGDIATDALTSGAYGLAGGAVLGAAIPGVVAGAKGAAAGARYAKEASPIGWNAETAAAKDLKNLNDELTGTKAAFNRYNKASNGINETLPEEVLQSTGLRPEYTADGNKFDNTVPVQKLKNLGDTEFVSQQKKLRELSDIPNAPKSSIDEIFNDFVKEVRQEFTGVNSVTGDEYIKIFAKELKAIQKSTGKNLLDLFEENELKRRFQGGGQKSYNAGVEVANPKAEAFRIAAKSQRKRVEKRAAELGYDVRGSNVKIASYNSTAELLNKVDNTPRKGGRVGDYVSKGLGGVAGSMIGGLPGLIIGATGAPLIRNALSRATGLINKKLMDNGGKRATLFKFSPNPNKPLLQLPEGKPIPSKTKYASDNGVVGEDIDKVKNSSNIKRKADKQETADRKSGEIIREKKSEIDYLEKLSNEIKNEITDPSIPESVKVDKIKTLTKLYNDLEEEINNTEIWSKINKEAYEDMREHTIGDSGLHKGLFKGVTDIETGSGNSTARALEELSNRSVGGTETVGEMMDKIERLSSFRQKIKEPSGLLKLKQKRKEVKKELDNINKM